MKRTAVLLAIAAVLASGGGVAEPARPQCQADDAIPEFVTRRIELVSAVGDAKGAPAVELERDPACRRGFGTEP